MDNKLTKKYGLLTAISMVVGIVIGSGVFFKAEKILTATNGNLTLGIFAWLIGGAIMVACGLVFANLASKYEHVNGIVDYAEAAFGSGYAYYVGWFMATLYYPTLTAVLSWVSARYTCVLFGFSDPITGPEVYVIAGFYLIASYALNTLSPIIAGKFQVSTTVIKLVPLGLVSVVGLISGLISGQTIENFTSAAVQTATGNPLLTSIVATAFAYEGWIIATSINAEIKDAKRNLPKAILIGMSIIVAVYVLYFIGISGAMPTADLIAGGEGAVKIAFGKLLGNLGGSLLFVFVVVSCLGTLNGLTMGNCRGLYSLAARKSGPDSKRFSQLDNVSNTPYNSAIFGLTLSAMWLVVWYGNFAGWWPLFLDISELPIVAMYAIYIPIFIWCMTHREKEGIIKGIILPIVATAGSCFMIYAAFNAHGVAVWAFLAIFAVVMLIGTPFKKIQGATTKK